MNKKEKISVADIVDMVITVLPMVFIILAVVLGSLRLRLQTESAVTVTAECQVVDKFVNSHNRAPDCYYITLLFKETGAEFEKDVQITVESFINDVNIGDAIPCTVMYDENGIVKIQVSNSSSVQQIDYQEDLMTILGVIFGIVGVITGVIGFFFLIKRLDKKVYEQSLM